MKPQKEKVKGYFTKAGQSVADKLNGWINPLSQTTKKKGLIVVGILTSVLCVMLMMQSISSSEPSSVLKVDQMTRPKDIHPQDTIIQQETEREIIDQYNRMIHFKELVDKLNSNEKALDSLMKAHPACLPDRQGLRDSLNEFLKQYY